MLKLFVPCLLLFSEGLASAQVACIGQKASKCPSGARHFPCYTSPDAAVAQMCPSGAGTYGKPKIYSGNRCGYHEYQIICTQQSSSSSSGRSSAERSGPANYIQLWDFGECGTVALARWKGYRNGHASATIQINYKVTTRQGNQTSEYSGSTTLGPGNSERLICNYQPGDTTNPLPTQRDISLGGAVFK